MQSIITFSLLALQLVNCLYFHIGENEKKCFIEDIPEDTLVVGNYKVELYDQNINKFVPSYPGLGMQVNVNDPEGKTIMSRNYAADGRFTFTSALAGEHVLCLESNTTFWGGLNQLRVHLRISVGERANDYGVIAEKDKLTELQLRIRQLLDQVEQISKEQDYQRYREERFRETSESTNSRVLFWAMAQLVVLVLAGFWQMYNLKSFFKAKKLV